MQNKKMVINVIVDYRDKFYSATKYWDASLDLQQLTKYFKKNGLEMRKWTFYEVSKSLSDFKNQLVVYQSSEDREGYYKSYIEDIILGLKIVGAILIPDYHMLRAHHNKCFMELLRSISDIEDVNKLKAHCFGTVEDYITKIDIFEKEPWVIKPAAGAMSKGVQLMKTKIEKTKVPLNISLSFQLLEYLKINIKHILRNKYKLYVRKSYHRKKFIIQEFIPGLTGDYKVLVYGEKYYTLSRKNRKNDFRASGGGALNINPIIPDGLLDYCKRIFTFFNIPFISLDIAIKDNQFYLIEFQFLSFGNYTLEKSEGCYINHTDKWVKTIEKPILEKEFANSINYFLTKNGIK